MSQVQACMDGTQRDERVWQQKPWWIKYKHELLSGLAMIVGMAAMFIPGPGWVAGGLLLASVAVDVVNISMYVQEGDITNAVLTGVFIIPVFIGGVIRLVQLTADAVRALRAGEAITMFGREVRLADGTLVWSTKTEAVIGPGRIPPSRPPVGDADNGPGLWQRIKRSPSGGDYQEQVSGVPRAVDGSTMEYNVAYTKPDGKAATVDFDGHVWRGKPPQEVYIDAKDGYNFPIVNRPWEQAADIQLRKWKEEATRQLDVLDQTGVNARVEWHFSDKAVAEVVEEYFKENHVNIIVIYTPKM